MDNDIQEIVSQRVAAQIGSMVLDILRLQATVEAETRRADRAEEELRKIRPDKPI